MGMIGELFHVGVAILSTTIDDVTNTVLAQLGSITEEYVFSDNAELYGSLGLAARPSKPTKGKSAAECVALKGDRDIILAARDKRGQSIYGNLREGETCLYGPGEFGTAQGRVIIKQDGSVTMLTTDNNLPPEQGGQAVMLKISPKDGLQFNSQWGSLVLDQTGFHMKTAAGPRIDMGGVLIPGLSAIPGIGTLVNSMGAYANISAPFVNLQGTSVALGMGPLYTIAAGGIPATLLAKGSPAGTPLSVTSVSALQTSTTVWISQ